MITVKALLWQDFKNHEQEFVMGLNFNLSKSDRLFKSESNNNFESNSNNAYKTMAQFYPRNGINGNK